MTTSRRVSIGSSAVYVGSDPQLLYLLNDQILHVRMINKGHAVCILATGKFSPWVPLQDLRWVNAASLQKAPRPQYAL